MAFEDWQDWKAANGMREYDYRTVFARGGDVARENGYAVDVLAAHHRNVAYR